MSFVRRVSLFLVLAAAGALRAQSTVPAVSQSLPAQALAPGGAPVTVDLRNYFNLPGVSGQVVQFDTALGKYNIELFGADAPLNVANFLNYVNRGAYANTIIHRSVAGFVIQGGGYTYSVNSTHIPTEPTVKNEFKRSNLRGTLAMAKLAAPSDGGPANGGPDSASSEWFINLADNSANLDNQNGGFTVFARVLGTGMSVTDAIAALPTYPVTFSAALTLSGVPIRGLAAGQTQLLLQNLVPVNSATVVPIYPATGGGTAVLGFTATSSASAVVAASISVSTLTLTPAAGGTANVTVRATDTNGNFVENTFTVTVAPVFGTQPVSQAVAPGSPAVLSVAATSNPAPTYQWQFNGSNLSGATGTTLTIVNFQPANAGLYTAVATSGKASTSNPAILGLVTTNKVIGAGAEFAANITHPNGNIYDQVLLSGAAATVTADAHQVTRTSFIDLTDDIVQVEFSGAGTLAMVLDNPSGPAAPVNYDQPAVTYMKGHVGIVITGADDTTNVSVFSVGRFTAFDPTGTFNSALPISSANNPANNGSPLFQGHASTVYDGLADLAFIAISSTNGKFGGLRASNGSFYATKGLTGVYAPGVQFQGPVFIGNINAFDAATPVIMIGSSPDTRITGGDLLQPNGQPVNVSGLTQLKFTAGANSHGVPLPAQTNKAVLLQNGVNVTDQVVVYP